MDAGFNIGADIIVFAVNSPLYNFKTNLVLSQDSYKELIEDGYKVKFSFSRKEYTKSSSSIRIERQYGMRKISKVDFDFDRYELRRNFPDFPDCP